MDKFSEWLGTCDDAGVEKHFVPETGVKTMQHGMLGTADVEIHGHPIALEVLRN